MKGWIQLTREIVDARQPSAFLRDALALFKAASASPESVDLAEAVDVDDAVAAAQQRAGRLKNADERAWGMAIAGVLGELSSTGSGGRRAASASPPSSAVRTTVVGRHRAGVERPTAVRTAVSPEVLNAP